MVMSSSIATEERLTWLASHLDKHVSVQLGQASTALGVREMTIRRDLRNLEGMGIVRRVRGGAVGAGQEDYRRSIAIEPQTCPPNALQTGEIDVLQPGEDLTLEWGYRTCWHDAERPDP